MPFEVDQSEEEDRRRCWFPRPCVQCAFAAVAMAIQFRRESLLSRFRNPGDEAYSERKL